MTATSDHAVNGHQAPLLNCPRCGLSIRPKASWLWLEYCPRCMGRAHVPVRLFSSPLRSGARPPAGAAPERTDPEPGADRPEPGP